MFEGAGEGTIASMIFTTTEAPVARMAPSSSRAAMMDEISELEVILEDTMVSLLLGSSSGLVGVRLANALTANKAKYTKLFMLK